MAIKKIIGKTQADGPHTLAFDFAKGEELQYNEHQIQITVRDGAGAATVPTAGTLEVQVQSPGSAEAEPIQDGVIDITVRDNWLQQINCRCGEMVFIPTGLDADKNYDVVVVSERA